MIEFEHGLKDILNNTKRLPIEKLPIDDSVGRILMEDVYSKCCAPPFNKSAMDGYAVKSADTKNAPVKLRCIGVVEAGEHSRKKVGRFECIKIMTGAMLLKDTDSVVMIEDTQRYGEYVEIKSALKKWQNVCFQGEAIKRGQKVIERETLISASDIALLATVGRGFVKTIRRPKVSVLNTGGEIVPAGRRLGRKKIYNSNGPQLLALLKRDAVIPSFLGIAEDKPGELRGKIKKGLESDMLLISGGVSMGDYDLVPGILEGLGVKKIFHKLNIKPGKPLFFGTQNNTLVFGIPGNPVSNFLAYSVFVRPALYKMVGNGESGPGFKEGILTRAFHQKPGRKHFVLIKIEKSGLDYYLTPLDSHGSGDTLALSKADGFMVVDADSSVIKAKTRIEFITWKTEKLII